MKEMLDDALRAARGKPLTEDEAVRLVRAYQVESAYRAFAPLAPALVDEDDHRRYLIEEAAVPVGDGASVCVDIVRPKAAKRLPALMEFTIYADHAVNFGEERRSASNGYVGVTGVTRGKGCGVGDMAPYEHEGHDGAMLVDWIARQPWSDGRVATFGASYDGFTQWAIAKHHPRALVAMMDSVDNGPGLDSPMDRGVFLNFGYSWPFYTTDNKTLDPETYGDRARWNKLFDTYYRTGAAYRSLPEIDGKPNPVYEHWLSHPTYDAFWRNLVPFGDEFASIDLPILTTTGYFEGSGDGAVYCLTQQLARRPNAEHYLVLGPYNHTLGNRGTVDVLGEVVDKVDGMPIDPAAHLDIGALRYQWFDHLLKGAPMPAVLKDRVNYEVMGENRWRHVPTLAAMGPQVLSFHPTDARDGAMFVLAPGKGGAGKAATLAVDLADRSDADRAPVGGGLIDNVIDLKDTIAFESAPFDHAFELSGLYRVDLDVMTNKKDFDFEIAFYEVTPDHRYVQLSYDFERASMIDDYTRRILFTPGQPRRLKFQASLFTSRKFEKGSRLLVLVEAMKSPFAEINYGTGKPVAEETIADAGAPLQVTLMSHSTIEVPTAPLP
jgi:putative CocE/NonD family hydrolase